MAAAASKKKINPALQSTNDLIECLDSALDNPELHDFSLMCQGHTVRCSKFVLAARSPVFRAMFVREGKKGQKNGMAVVEHYQPEALEAFLQLLYTGKSKNADKNAW